MQETNGTKIENVEDPFDPAKLKLSQDFVTNLGVKKTILTVPVRKPDRQWFIRVHPEEKWRLETAILEIKEDRENYLVDPSLWPHLPGEIAPKVLFTATNRQGVTFLWPVRLAGEDGKWDDWNKSAFNAARLAMKGWVRVAANLSLGAYDVFEATANLPEPLWPELDFPGLLRVAFKDRFIQSLDHPVLKKLRGES